MTEQCPPTIVPRVAANVANAQGTYPVHTGTAGLMTTPGAQEFTPTDRLVPAPAMTQTSWRAWVPSPGMFRDSHGFEHMARKIRYRLSARPVAPPVPMWALPQNTTTVFRGGRTVSVDVSNAQAPRVRVYGAAGGK